jgi:DNA-binding HxlR family transcriptional regulator
LIVHEILNGHTTFNEIKKELKGISSNLLSERLKYLEEEGLIKAELYTNHPPRYRYTLTKSGEELEDVFNSLIIWGSSHLKKCYKRIVDATTGDDIGIAYYNKKTGELVDNIQVIPFEKVSQKAADN